LLLAVTVAALRLLVAPCIYGQYKPPACVFAKSLLTSAIAALLLVASSTSLAPVVATTSSAVASLSAAVATALLVPSASTVSAATSTVATATSGVAAYTSVSLKRQGVWYMRAASHSYRDRLHRRPRHAQRPCQHEWCDHQIWWSVSVCHNAPRSVADALYVVHGLDRGIGSSIVIEAHEAEATAAACIAILHYDLRSVSGHSFAFMVARGTYCLLDLAEFFELLTQGVVISVPCEAAYEGQSSQWCNRR